MTIKQCAKEKGIEIDCDVTIHRWGEVEVNFLNTVDNAEDSTTFDIAFPLGENGLCELISLFEDFCQENGIKKNTVESLKLLHVAETYDELTKIC